MAGVESRHSLNEGAMTLGLGVTLPDGIILMADGRLIQRTGALFTDEADKIIQLSPSVFAIPAGVEAVTSAALHQLRQEILPDDSCNTIVSKAKLAIGRYWEFLMQDLRAQGAENHPNNNAAFLIAGHDPAGDFFLIEIVQNNGEAIQECSAREPDQVIAIGDADPYQLASEIALGKSANPWIQEECLNPWVQFVAARMQACMAEASLRSPGIGGTIRCAILRRGHPAVVFICP